MKKIAFLLGAFLTMGLCSGAFAQSGTQKHGFVIGTGAGSADAQAKWDREEPARKAALMQQVREFLPKDPWRVINATTNYAKGGNWRHFTGTVIAVTESGVLFEGNYGAPLQIPQTEPRQFFVANFPYKVAVDDKVLGKEKFVALESGVLELVGSSVPKLEYGKSCAIPQVAVTKPKTSDVVKKVVK